MIAVELSVAAYHLIYIAEYCSVSIIAARFRPNRQRSSVLLSIATTKSTAVTGENQQVIDSTNITAKSAARNLNK